MFEYTSPEQYFWYEVWLQIFTVLTIIIFVSFHLIKFFVHHFKKSKKD